MIALQALAVFAGSLAFLALGSKGLAFQIAAYTAIAFKSGSDLIYSRMPTVLNGPWWVLASVTSALFSWAFVARNLTPLVLTLIGIGVTAAYTGIRAHRLVKLAACEVGIPWPSDASPE